MDTAIVHALQLSKYVMMQLKSQQQAEVMQQGRRLLACSRQTRRPRRSASQRLQTLLSAAHRSCQQLKLRAWAGAKSLSQTCQLPCQVLA